MRDRGRSYHRGRSTSASSGLFQGQYESVRSHLAYGVPFGLPPEQHVDKWKNEGYDIDRLRDMGERGEVQKH